MGGSTYSTYSSSAQTVLAKSGAKKKAKRVAPVPAGVPKIETCFSNAIAHLTRPKAYYSRIGKTVAHFGSDACFN